MHEVRPPHRCPPDARRARCPDARRNPACRLVTADPDGPGTERPVHAGD